MAEGHGRRRHRTRSWSPSSAASTGCAAPSASRSSPTARRSASGRAPCSTARATDAPLTIASAEAVQDGPGWRLRFARGHRAARAPTRCASAYLETDVRPDARPRPRRGLLARGHRRRRSRGLDGTELGHGPATSTASAENEVYVVRGGPVRRVRPARGPGVHPDLRATPRRDRRRRRGARPAAAEGPPDRRRPAAAPRRATAQAGRRRRRAGRRRDDRRRRRADRARGAAATDHDPRDRRPDPLPGDGRGPARPRASRAASRSGASPTIRVHDLRELGLGRHRTVDDTPYGGGAGMVLRAEPIVAAHRVASAAPDSTVILLDPGGEVFRQARAADLAGARRTSSSSARATRASTSGSASFVDLELSIGDYVLTGGELPALVVIDAVIRLLPGRHRRRVDRRGVVQRRPPRVPAVHAAAAFRGHGRAADPDLAATTARSPAGATSRRVDADARPADRTCSPPRMATEPASPGPTSCYTPPPVAPGARPSRHAPPRSLGCPRRPRNRRVNVLDEIVQDQLRTDLPELASGDTVKVSAKVVEGNRERIQVFEGTVMRLRGGGITRTDHRPPHRVAASASSGRSRSTARASTRSRSSATARSAAPSCTSCASASARRPRSASAAPTARRRAGSRAPRDPARPAGSFDSSGTLAVDGRHRPDPPPRAPPVERRADPRRRRRRGRGRARPAARSSRRP